MKYGECAIYGKRSVIVKWFNEQLAKIKNNKEIWVKIYIPHEGDDHEEED